MSADYLFRATMPQSEEVIQYTGCCR